MSRRADARRLPGIGRLLWMTGPALGILAATVAVMFGTAAPASADCGGQVTYQAGVPAQGCPQAATWSAIAVVALAAAAAALGPLLMSAIQSASSRADMASLAQALAAARAPVSPASQAPEQQPQTGRPVNQNRPGNPARTSTPEASRECRGDPVDVATGEVVLGQTDAELPGVLPLILRRTHVSSYRAGSHFGRSWASTVDQRLEWDAHGAIYVADDGMLLTYPAPPATGQVMAKAGPRWPLAHDAAGYSIHRPETGQTLYFTGDASAVTHLTSISDRNGNRIHFDRTPDGVLTAVRHSAGYHIDASTEDGLITELQLRGPGGAGISLVRCRYNEQRHLVQVTNSSRQALTFRYDAEGRLTQWTDRNDESYHYTYDEHGRCVASEGSGGFLDGRFSYDTANRTTQFTDALGHTTSYWLDEMNRVAAETDPLGNTTASEWDRYGRLLSSTDPLGRSTRYQYDDAGNLTRLIRPDGSALRASYNSLGLPEALVEPGGGTWRREYDERGNMLSLTDPAGAVTRCGYDEHGALSLIVDATGGEHRFENNAAGLPVSVTDPAGGVTRHVRDPFGRSALVTDPVGGTERFTWTVEGLPLSHTFPDGTAERWRHDGEGNQIEYTDPLGQVTRTEYTHFDRPSAQTGPDGATLKFHYDPALRLTAVTSAHGLTWHYAYDPAGRLVSETDFNGRTLSYAHDAAGQLTERTNGAGETVRFTRDLLGRVTGRHAADGDSVFEFDPAGRLLRAANADAEVVLERDACGRVVTESVNGRAVQSAYDLLGRRTARRTPAGQESTWEYGENGLPAYLRAAQHSMSFRHDPAGREVERVLNGGTMLTRSWDANHRLVTLTAGIPVGRDAPAYPTRLIQQRRYQYRPDGYLTAVDDHPGGARQFELDPAGRVTAVHGSGWRERYRYDAAGNITEAEWPQPGAERAAQGSRSYDGTLIRSAGDIRYDHDAQGRVVLKRRMPASGVAETWRYNWDSDDRLTSVVTPDGTRWRYRYDPLGRRVAKQRLAADGVTVAEQADFAWDGATMAEQAVVSGQEPAVHTTTWYFDPDGLHPISQSERLTQRAAPQQATDERFYAIITDLVGTPTELAAPDGKIAWQGTASLWGAPAWRSAGGYTPLRFPGQYHDPETGLHYNNQRYYDPATARYLSVDPLGLTPDPNPNAYVHNPHTWSDPLGLVPGSCAQPRGRHRAGPGRPSYLSARHRAGPGRPSYSSPGGLGYGKVPYRPSLSEYARYLMANATPDAEASEYAERGGFGGSVAELLINISNYGLERNYGFKIPEIDSETWDQLGQMAGYYGKALFDLIKRVGGG